MIMESACLLIPHVLLIEYLGRPNCVHYIESCGTVNKF